MPIICFGPSLRLKCKNSNVITLSICFVRLQKVALPDQLLLKLYYNIKSHSNDLRLRKRNALNKLSRNDTDVLKTLEASGQPQSAYDILKLLKAGDLGRINAPVQIYRSLEKLINQKLVHRIASMNAYIVCSHPHHDFEPGFFRCRSCGSVTEFNLSQAVDTLRCSSGAPHIEAMNVEIEGTCHACHSIRELSL